MSEFLVVVNYFQLLCFLGLVLVIIWLPKESLTITAIFTFIILCMGKCTM